MKIKRTVQEWSIDELIQAQTRISFPEFQREKKLWSIPQKALLIDSILRDFDIPKLYFNQTEKNKDDFEVIDGQQRLWAIWDFFNDEYSIQWNEDELKFSQLSGPKYKTVRNTIEKYKLQITVFEEANEDYLRELFVRLQWGLLLVTGEKLNAASGEMKTFVFDQLAKRNFILELGLPKERTRYARETLCAQISINSFTRAQPGNRFARTRYEDLLGFFNAYAHPTGKDRTFFDRQTKKITTTIDQLGQALAKDTKSFSNRSYLLSVYLLFEKLADKEGKVPENVRKEFAEFVVSLRNQLKEEAKKGFNRTDEDLYRFQAHLSSAPTERYQIERRHEELRKFYDRFKSKSRKTKS
ncbi:MAG: hypothetical protein QOH70_898 [Blastocatellia bacterium]|jgi:hypothetical protein|nr:hypothetical protein [Blastocatellia bacterium]